MKSILYLYFLSLTLASSLQEELKLVFSYLNGGNIQVQRGVSKYGIDYLGNVWLNPGEISPYGLRAQFLLGRGTWVKYQNFTSDTFNPLEWFIQSIEFNNSLTSTQAFMTGFFPSQKASLTSYQQSTAVIPVSNSTYTLPSSLGSSPIVNNIQVFPIHLFESLDEVNFYLYGFISCNPIVQVINQNTNNTQISTFITSFESKYGQQLEKMYSINSTVVKSYDFIFTLLTAININNIEGNSLNALSNNNINITEILNDVKTFLWLDLYVRYNSDVNSILSKITVSQMVDYVFPSIDAFILNNKTIDYFPKKYSVFTMTDISLASFLNLMNLIYNTTLYDVPYNSLLSFELLYNTTDSHYYINILFNEKVIKKEEYSLFKTRVSQYYMSKKQILNFCQYVQEEKIGIIYYYLLIAFAVLTGVFLAAFIVVLICCCCCYESLNKKEENKAQVILTTMGNETPQVKSKKNIEHEIIPTTERQGFDRVSHKIN